MELINLVVYGFLMSCLLVCASSVAVICLVISASFLVDFLYDKLLPNVHASYYPDRLSFHLPIAPDVGPIQPTQTEMYIDPVPRRLFLSGQKEGAYTGWRREHRAQAIHAGKQIQKHISGSRSKPAPFRRNKCRSVRSSLRSGRYTARRKRRQSRQSRKSELKLRCESLKIPRLNVTYSHFTTEYSRRQAQK